MSIFSWLGIGKAREPSDGDTNVPKVPTIYCDPDSGNALAVFESGSFQTVDDPQDADLLWIYEDDRPFYRTMKPFQLLNHLPTENAVADKGLLAEHLKAHDRSQTQQDFRMKDLMQETYCLYIPEERARFFSQLPPKDTKENLWILKPCDSSMGRGIHIQWRFDKLREFYAPPNEHDLQPQQEQDVLQRYVIQRYIQNPLLLEGRKSEIRIYWLVACLDPLLVLMYREGQVRLNAMPFSLDDFGNTLIHVTNVYQQKAHPEFDPSAVLKWSFSDLENYLIHELKIAPENYIEEHLKPQLKRMVSFVSHAAAPTLAEHCGNGLCFGFYGADIIFDDQLHPWLTEVQGGPGLDFDDPIKRKVIPAMLNETAAIMFEISRRIREGLSLKTLDAVQGFEWVVNEA
jgi:hypothetical protein